MYHTSGKNSQVFLKILNLRISFQTSGHKITYKEELLKAIEHQLQLGPKGLLEEDRFLLECNFDELTSTSGEQQEYWLLTIQARNPVAS